MLKPIFLSLSLLGAGIFFGAPVGVAHAQEMEVRSGVVVAITGSGVAQQQPERSERGRRFGAAIGRAVGYAVARESNYRYGYEAVNAGEAIGSEVGANGNGRQQQGGPLTVVIRFDSGRESAIVSPNAQSLRVGQRVRIYGSGSSAQVVGE